MIYFDLKKYNQLEVGEGRIRIPESETYLCIATMEHGVAQPPKTRGFSRVSIIEYDFPKTKDVVIPDAMGSLIATESEITDYLWLR